MSTYSHFLQLMYLGVPLLSAALFLAFALWLVFILHRTKDGMNGFGWTVTTIVTVVAVANAWVFLQVYGIYAARSVLG